MPRRHESDAAQRHTPVLLQRCLDLLAPALESDHPVLIDCTLGMGGHSEGALTRFETLTVIGIDRDPEAIALASARLAPFGDRFRAVHTTYDHVDEVARDASPYGDGTVDAILMDLGVSSLQLDDAGRGFSYSRPAPLDMRMDQSVGTTAQQLLDTADEREITRILRTYGEERFAPRIAAALVRRREAGRPVRETADLAELVRESVPAAARRTGGHPAKRTFQALRIAVNAELEVLERAVPRALNSIRVGGRLVVESYQSLEDRIVKQAIAVGTTTRAPEGLPFVPDDAAPYLAAVTHGAEKADDDELASNPRSAPVRLRAAIRLRPAADAPAPEPERAADPGPRRSRPTGTDRTSKTTRGRRKR
ncbi:16S rRNA (cytosine(1402)-N(4))-methyltransferase RsmH [Actinomyces respiraculi]|uniref:16S rRNA (cytosine(1402)-N(4))-methyltransferase RsmH n=1 Tax=Actinomyces respiraculi TaxID=2744574 RepID=UPI00141F3B5B|nr:16S rRNA (cytosine(1402)-N(4))-methyltransferase RsmH [Actinomyces respiraculi]